MLRLYVPTLILILISISVVVMNPMVIQHIFEEWSTTHLEIETESEYEVEDERETEKHKNNQIYFASDALINKTSLKDVFQFCNYDSPYLSIPEIPPEIS